MPRRYRSGFALLLCGALACSKDAPTAADPTDGLVAGLTASAKETPPCPDGYELVEVKRGLKVDVNDNGLVCRSVDGKDVIDDTIDVGGGDAKVTGHGNFFDAESKEGFRDISFSFHGKQTDSDGTAKGNFEFHDQTSGIAIHGDVICVVMVKPTVALLVGVITRSNDADLPEDTEVAWMAEDAGEGSNSPPDHVGALSAGGKKKKGEAPGCAEGRKLAPLRPIDGGNIQVH